jgi:Fe-S-cluster containining protein
LFLNKQAMTQTDLRVIAADAEAKADENDHFLAYILRSDGARLDRLVQPIYQQVQSVVDCTQCGNCCKTLVINITPDEVTALAGYLGQPEAALREACIEESLQGHCFINTIPCHFLKENKCSIYAQRFTECRDFPHLHKPGFRERLLGTLGHYGRCPIIYNVIEAVKEQSGFKTLSTSETSL